MNAYDLPTSLTIGEVAYSIRYQWRAVLDVLCVSGNPELDEQHKALGMLQIFYPDWEKIPAEHINEALEKASEFIDCGQRSDGKVKPRMIDWELDAPLIVPEINKVAGREIRLDPDLHWWTFFGWFMGIGDGLFASVLHCRGKLAKGKKLEKWEREFYDANRTLVDIRQEDSEEIRAEKENMLKYL